MTTRENAEKEGMPILGKWVSTAVVGVQPRYMGISPVAAIPAVLERVGLSKDEVDIYEVGVWQRCWDRTDLVCID
jgi:acetyl-CoA acyltransferase 1